MKQAALAVKQLRKRTKESQQAFANRLGLSMSAIGNYEQGRIPTGRVLAKLSLAAAEMNELELSAVFSAALADELGIPKTGTARAHLWSAILHLEYPTGQVE